MTQYTELGQCIFIGECILVSNAFNYTWYFTQTDVQYNSTCEYVTCFLNADYIVCFFLEPRKKQTMTKYFQSFYMTRSLK